MIYHRRQCDGVEESGQMAAGALERFAQRDPEEQDLIIRLARIPILDPKVPKREREMAEIQARQLEQVRRLGRRPVSFSSETGSVSSTGSLSAEGGQVSEKDEHHRTY